MLSSLAGVIDTEDSLRFKRIVFRVTRGNNLIFMKDIKDVEGKTPKSVFFIAHQNGEHEYIKNKLKKVCESFQASTYDTPYDVREFESKLHEINSQIAETKNLKELTRGNIQQYLDMFSEERN